MNRASLGAIVATIVWVGVVPAQTLNISQIYGGGGNTGAPLNQDYIEIVNPMTFSQDLTGFSVQYAAAAGTTWQVTALPSFTLQPGQYFLIAEGTVGGVGVALPTPDATGGIAMAATAGKVALVSNTTALTGANPLPNASILDFVGYGTTANAFEGSGPAPAPSNTMAIFRQNFGLLDTNNNAGDFVVLTPAPRNTASPFAPVPEPVHGLLVCLGSLGLYWRSRRTNASAQRR